MLRQLSRHHRTAAPPRPAGQSAGAVKNSRQRESKPALAVVVRRFALVAALLIAAATSAACGYGFVDGASPFGGSRVAVLTFAEYVPLGIAPDLQRYLAELAEHEGARVVFQSAKADEIIRGVIRLGTTNALPITDPLAAISAYQITVQIDAQMTDSHGTVVWASTLSFTEDFLPGAGLPSQSTLGTEASRRRALDRLAQKAAREIYDRIVMTDAMGIKAQQLVAGRNVPRLSPWAPLPPLTAAGAPIYGPHTTPAKAEPPVAPATWAPEQLPITPATPNPGTGVEADEPAAPRTLPRPERPAYPLDEKHDDSVIEDSTNASP